MAAAAAAVEERPTRQGRGGGGHGRPGALGRSPESGRRRRRTGTRARQARGNPAAPAASVGWRCEATTVEARGRPRYARGAHRSSLILTEVEGERTGSGAPVRATTRTLPPPPVGSFARTLARLGACARAAGRPAAACQREPPAARGGVANEANGAGGEEEVRGRGGSGAIPAGPVVTRPPARGGAKARPLARRRHAGREGASGGCRVHACLPLLTARVRRGGEHGTPGNADPEGLYTVSGHTPRDTASGGTSSGPRRLCIRRAFPRASVSRCAGVSDCRPFSRPGCADDRQPSRPGRPSLLPPLPPPLSALTPAVPPRRAGGAQRRRRRGVYTCATMAQRPPTPPPYSRRGEHGFFAARRPPPPLPPAPSPPQPMRLPPRRGCRVAACRWRARPTAPPNTLTGARLFSPTAAPRFLPCASFTNGRSPTGALAHSRRCRGHQKRGRASCDPAAVALVG